MCTSYSHIVETGGGFSLIPLIITRWEAAWLCAPHTTMLWKPDVSSVGISLLKCTSYNRTVETGGGFSGKQHGYVHLLQPHCGNWRWVQWEATWLCAPLTTTLWKLEVGSVGSNLVMRTSYSHTVETGGGFSGKQPGYVHPLQLSLYNHTIAIHVLFFTVLRISSSCLKGGQGCLMFSSCLESQGRHLIPLSCLLSCFFSA